MHTAKQKLEQTIVPKREEFPALSRSAISIAVMLVVAGTFALGSSQASANGGNGISIFGGAEGGLGGTDGNSSSATGQNGGTGPTANAAASGGGGALDLTTGAGAAGGAAGLYGTGMVYGTSGATGTVGMVVTTENSISNTVSGGTGQRGQTAVTNVNSAGGNGGGGAGVQASADVTVTGTGVVTGGMGAVLTNAGGGGGGAGIFSSANVTIDAGGKVSGGAGSTTLTGSSGGGGQGGAAIALNGSGTVTNSGTLTGGNGERSLVAGGGDGGAGVEVVSGGTVLNAAGGTITGGNGGGGVVRTTGVPTTPGAGGAGITGSNVTVINAGAITGGAGGTGSGRTPVSGDAIEFTGGVNSLELQAGSTINGSVVAFSAADMLKLGGGTDSSFDVSAIGASAQYQGFGVFEKTGTSTWTLTGASTEATPWTVQQGTLALDSAISLTNSSFAINNSGTLQVNGSNTNSVIAINTGGTLRGIGTVGATTVHAGGVIAPGNSIGTLNVNGAYTQEKGGIYQVEVDPTSSASDRIAVTGTATIQNGAVIDVTKTSAAPYVAGTKYTVITATNGVTGTFDVTGDSQLSAFFGLTSGFDANSSFLEVKQTQSIGDVATTPNQAAVAGGLESAGADSAAAAPVLNQQTNDDARMALDQLSGEVYASVQSAMLESSHLTRDAVTDRLTDLFTCPSNGATDTDNRTNAATPGVTSCGTLPGHPMGWAKAYGNWGHLDGNGNANRLNTSVGGFFVGADMPVFNNWRAGVLAGYSHGTYDENGQNASAASDDYHIGLYGGTQWGALGFRTGAAYTWHDISADRDIAVPGFADHLSSNYHAGTAQVFGELGYRMDMGRASVEPFANIAYVNQHAQGFDENGGADALHVGSQDMNTGFSTLGLRGKTTFALKGAEVLVKGTVGWRYAVGDVTPTVSESFAGGSSFDLSGVPIARNEAVVDLGLGVHVTRNATVSVSYTGQYGSGVTNQGVLGALNIAF